MAKLIVDISDNLKSIIEEQASKKDLTLKDFVLLALSNEVPSKAKFFLAEASKTIREAN